MRAPLRHRLVRRVRPSGKQAPRTAPGGAGLRLTSAPPIPSAQGLAPGADGCPAGSAASEVSCEQRVDAGRWSSSLRRRRGWRRRGDALHADRAGPRPAGRRPGRARGRRGRGCLRGPRSSAPVDPPAPLHPDAPQQSRCGGGGAGRSPQGVPSALRRQASGIAAALAVGDRSQRVPRPHSRPPGHGGAASGRRVARRPAGRARRAPGGGARAVCRYQGAPRGAAGSAHPEKHGGPPPRRDRPASGRNRRRCPHALSRGAPVAGGVSRGPQPRVRSGSRAHRQGRRTGAPGAPDQGASASLRRLPERGRRDPDAWAIRARRAVPAPVAHGGPLAALGRGADLGCRRRRPVRLRGRPAHRRRHGPRRGCLRAGRSPGVRPHPTPAGGGAGHTMGIAVRHGRDIDPGGAGLTRFAAGIPVGAAGLGRSGGHEPCRADGPGAGRGERGRVDRRPPPSAPGSRVTLPAPPVRLPLPLPVLVVGVTAPGVQPALPPVVGPGGVDPPSVEAAIGSTPIGPAAGATAPLYARTTEGEGPVNALP